MQWRDRLAAAVENRRFQQFIIAVIVFNAITLAMETSESIMAGSGDLLHVLDKIVLAIFVAELVAKLVAFGPRFFSDGWNVFDLVVVVIALVPASGPFAVLRALRVLRVLRLISAVPAMRKVVSGLLSAIPGMASIVALLGLVLFVSAVMATNLFRDVAPQYFGDLGTSLFALFQIMTGESWPDIADAVMAEMPLAWIFFVIYILISTFAVLNLFIAVVVNAMEAQLREEMHQEGEQHHQELADSNATILAELQALRAEVAQLRAGLDGQRVSATDGAN
ncbi:ion transporter [Thermocrispum sp.]|uniref:Ion transporter n=1 Tax=Thermocrispum agreste TaxID=37925 RepID=A0ABD6FJN5_9PSEU|nr:ion transporter [Thermocrispum sp.]